MSWTVNSPDMAVVEEQMEEGRRPATTTSILKVGPPQTPEYDRQLVRKVRDFAPRGFHWADANTGYELAARAPHRARAGRGRLSRARVAAAAKPHPRATRR